MHLLTSISGKTQLTFSHIVHSALLPLTLQGDNSNTFPLVTGRTTKGFYFRCPTNSNILKISLNFRVWEKRPQLGNWFLAVRGIETASARVLSRTLGYMTKD